MRLPVTGPGDAGDATHACAACGTGALAFLADLGEIPVRCGARWTDRAEAIASPLGRMRLAYCRSCAYVRNVAFEPTRIVYDPTMDASRHRSRVLQQISAELVAHLGDRFALAGKRVLDIGCGQGEFLRELCRRTGSSGVGYDARYAGATGPDSSGAAFHASLAPRGGALPEFDVFTSRNWLEHVVDPYEFLADLRGQAGDRLVWGYVEVPDAGYDLGTAGWEVSYPHVSYFDAYSLCRIFQRAGWRVEATGTSVSGMVRWIEVSSIDRPGSPTLPGLAARDAQLAAVRGFAARHVAERDRWRHALARLAADGARPVLWGVGARSAQFLHLVDRHAGALSAVVDVDPDTWGRYLSGSGHRVDPPEALAKLQPRAVVTTDPADRDEIRDSLAGLGVPAELMVA